MFSFKSEDTEILKIAIFLEQLIFPAAKTCGWMSCLYNVYEAL